MPVSRQTWLAGLGDSRHAPVAGHDHVTITARVTVDDMETDDEILGDEPVYERAQDFVDHLDEFIESVDGLDPAAAWEWAPLNHKKVSKPCVL